MRMEKIELHIEGMHCGACATGIQMLVSQMEGVSQAFVDYEGEKGAFEFDPAKVTKEKIIAEIATLGYKGVLTPHRRAT
ncbi:MAG: heavy-metal-associated domain-containing protein [Patescibacteria group bacterium]